MKFEIVPTNPTLYLVWMDGDARGEISGYSGHWQFHYRANWVNPPREQEEKLWKMINDKLTVLNLTSRLLR